MAIDVNMFWHGPRLGPMHAACVRSFLRHGHTVIMHCYERPEDLPDGVRVFDAARIMPLSDLISHKKSGSLALGANRYRYRLITDGFGAYADCDVFCLRPLTDAQFILGAEQNDSVNNAILKFPVNSTFRRGCGVQNANGYICSVSWAKACMSASIVGAPGVRSCSRILSMS